MRIYYEKIFFLVLTLFFILIISSFSVKAKNNKDDLQIIFEEISYYETKFEDGKFKEQKKLDKYEYDNKVKAKKINRETKLVDKITNLPEIMMSSCGHNFCLDPGDGGGGITYYTISFNSDGGSLVSSITKPAGTAVSKPQDPIRTNYVFDGWYKDSSLTQEYAFTTMPSYNIT